MFELSLNIKREKEVFNMVFKVEREEYINKTFRIEKRLLEDMEKLCDKKNISLNKLVVKCIKYAMDNLDEEDK
jgi:hypothetical protein